jgi:hypothetical protein
MSHFTTIKTEVKYLEVLVETLEGVVYFYTLKIWGVTLS